MHLGESDIAALGDANRRVVAGLARLQIIAPPESLSVVEHERSGLHGNDYQIERLDRRTPRTAGNAIHVWRPWERATGPRTAAGKAISSGNAARPDSLRRQLHALAAEMRTVQRQVNKRRKV
jgi:hypothetical protein